MAEDSGGCGYRLIMFCDARYLLFLEVEPKPIGMLRIDGDDGGCGLEITVATNSKLIFSITHFCEEKFKKRRKKIKKKKKR